MYDLREGLPENTTKDTLSIGDVFWDSESNKIMQRVKCRKCKNLASLECVAPGQKVTVSQCPYCTPKIVNIDNDKILINGTKYSKIDGFYTGE